MTKKLEELFNLDEKKELEKKQEQTVAHQEVKNLDESFGAVQDITKSLPEITELDNLDEKELDSLANKAEQAYDDLMDLGMNVEVRYSGRIFEVASSMLKNAIDAKSTKIDKKLKAVDMQLKKLKIDRDTRPETDEMINGEGYVISDRNDLLKKLSGKE